MFKANMRRSGKKGIKAIEISFNDQLSLFTGRAKVQLERVSKDKQDEENNLFECLNVYVTSVLSNEQQLQLYKLYEKAHDVIVNGKFFDYHSEIARLKPICDSIIDLIGPEKYCAFIENSEYLVIPKNLSEAAGKGDYPVQTTISNTDYVNIVKFLFVTRTVFPIVFGLMDRLEGSMGSGYSVMVCGDLIKDNYFIQRMFGWEKLKAYFKFSFDKRPTPIQIESGGNTEAFIEKVLFSAIFERLCCAVIPETEYDKNIANTINGAVRQHESSVSFRNKEDRPHGGDDEDKRSSFDKYNIVEKVRDSDVQSEAEYFSFGLFDEKDNPRYINCFKHQCNGLGIKQPDLVDKIYRNLPINWDFELNEVNQNLLSLVFNQVVSPDIWEECSYVQLMAAISLGQVRLSEWGYMYLPSLLGCIADPEGPRSLAEGLKLTDDDKNYLASICDVQSRNSENRGFNEALLSADRFFSELTNRSWKSNLEYGVLDDFTIYDRVIPGDIFPLDLENEIRLEFMHLVKRIND